jgi:hypothetical protein
VQGCSSVCTHSSSYSMPLHTTMALDEACQVILWCQGPLFQWGLLATAPAPQLHARHSPACNIHLQTPALRLAATTYVTLSAPLGLASLQLCRHHTYEGGRAARSVVTPPVVTQHTCCPTVASQGASWVPAVVFAAQRPPGRCFSCALRLLGGSQQHLVCFMVKPASVPQCVLACMHLRLVPHGRPIWPRVKAWGARVFCRWNGQAGGSF